MKNIQEHVKMYTNRIVSKNDIKQRAKQLNMTESEYINYCVELEINKSKGK